MVFDRAEYGGQLVYFKRKGMISTYPPPAGQAPGGINERKRCAVGA